MTPREKRSNILNEVKPVKNINRNLRIFLEIRPVQLGVISIPQQFNYNKDSLKKFTKDA